MVAWSTAAVTVLGGVAVFVLGQFVLKWLIEPLQEYRELKGEISHVLLFYANVNDRASPDEISETRRHLRGLSGRLRKIHAKIPFYNLCSVFSLVPVREDLFKASTELVGWSNDLDQVNGKVRHRRTIAECLGIEEVY